MDDFPSMRRILRNELHDLGFTHVEVAENGAVGLDKARDGQFDLVIADWNMPRMDGLAMLREMRQETGLRHVPVLMVTGEARRASILEAARAGADGYIVKPFSAATLEARIVKILARRRSQPAGAMSPPAAHVPRPASALVQAQTLI